MEKLHLLTIASSACLTRSAVLASNSAFKRLKAENKVVLELYSNYTKIK